LQKHFSSFVSSISFPQQILVSLADRLTR
jgi:hypothetical protein